MDPPLVNETSFSAANPSAYTLTEIWPFSSGGDATNGILGLRMGNLSGVSMEESTVTEQSVGFGNGNARKRKDNTTNNFSSEDDSSKLVSTSSSGNDLHDSNIKRMKLSASRSENGNSKGEVDTSSASNKKAADQSSKQSEPPKQDYIHVRARRGQATDSHSLAERARREKISERMKILQDLVPGCNKVIGKALVLDEIINYIQSLQRQVEFLSMKLETVNSRMNMNLTVDGFHAKDAGVQPFDAAGMIFGAQAVRDYAQAFHHEWLHMQLGGSLERTT